MKNMLNLNTNGVIIGGMDTNDLLTVKQVAERHNRSSSAVHHAIRRGELPSQMLLGRVVVTRAACEAWKPQGSGGARPGSGPKPKAKAEGEQVE